MDKVGIAFQCNQSFPWTRLEQHKLDADRRHQQPVSADNRLVPGGNTARGMLGLHAKAWLSELDGRQMERTRRRKGKARSMKAAWIRQNSRWTHEYMAASIIRSLSNPN